MKKDNCHFAAENICVGGEFSDISAVLENVTVYHDLLFVFDHTMSH